MSASIPDCDHQAVCELLVEKIATICYNTFVYIEHAILQLNAQKIECVCIIQKSVHFGQCAFL